MDKFKVLRPLVFDGKPREVGQTIEATAERVRHPVAKGYIEPVKATRRKPS